MNAADGERLVSVLRARGLRQAESPSLADLRIVNSCSVTTSAAAQSRMATRKATSLPLLKSDPDGKTGNARVIVTGCWATSDPDQAAAIPGVAAVITHHQDVVAELSRALTELGVPASPRRLELLQAGQSQSGGSQSGSRQRAFLKVQDGCDAFCTYCIIPQLRPKLWSIDPDQAVAGVRNLVAAGHKEVILTGIFLGAYGQPTALRRRQETPAGSGLARLIDRICDEVPELPRLRLSSLEPGDLTDDLLESLAGHRQVVPHFHLPLQSGSEAVLKRMNRQYSADDFRRLVDRLCDRFDRPALTTDIVTGFPGEDDGDFADTLKAVDHAGFIHVHAFPFSPRPGTAAARWTDEFVPGAVAHERIAELTRRAESHSLAFRKSFSGETVEIIVERGRSRSGNIHGRCERYFDVEVPGVEAEPGTRLAVRVGEAVANSTVGTIYSWV